MSILMFREGRLHSRGKLIMAGMFCSQTLMFVGEEILKIQKCLENSE